MPVLPDDARVAGLAPDLDDLGIGLQAHVVRVDEDVPEAPGQALLLVGVERLVAEEDDAVLEQRLPDAGDGGVVGVPRQVDAVDLGAKSAGDRMDLEASRNGHDGVSSSGVQRRAAGSIHSRAKRSMRETASAGLGGKVASSTTSLTPRSR